jgi:hypothetical protein
VASGGGSPSNAHDGESSLNGHFPQHLWASVEDLPQRWKVVVDVCHNLKTIDKDATMREAEANPAGSEASRLRKRRMRLLPARKINVFGCELCRLPAKQSRFAVQQSKSACLLWVIRVRTGPSCPPIDVRFSP